MWGFAVTEALLVLPKAIYAPHDLRRRQANACVLTYSA